MDDGFSTGTENIPKKYKTAQKSRWSAGIDTSTAGVAIDSSANSFLIGLTQEGNTEIGAIIALLTTNYKNREN